MARARFKKDPSLGGRGLATAGLIVGYSLLAISTIVIGAMIAAFLGGIRKGMEQAAQPGGGGRIRVERSTSVKPAAIDATPDGSGWTLKLEGVEIPSSPVTGRIHGSPFTAEQTRTQGGWITLRQGADFFPDLEFSVVLFENNLNQLAGRTFTVPGGQGTTPHIWMKWKEAGQNVPKQTSFTKDYAMRLEFGPMSNGKLPGKIYLCVPDEQKSYMRGTFEIDTQAKAGRPAAGSPRPRPGTGRPGQGKGATP